MGGSSRESKEVIVRHNNVKSHPRNILNPWLFLFRQGGAKPKRAMMDFKTLLQKHQVLLAENKALKEENAALKARLGKAEHLGSPSSPEGVWPHAARTGPLANLRQ